MNEQREGSPAFMTRLLSLLGADEIDRLARSGMGMRMGFGRQPALLVVDAQNYMIGAVDHGDITEYPSRCPGACDVVPVIRELARAFRERSKLVVFTRQVTRADGLDYGVKRYKRTMVGGEGWYVEGTRGAELSPGLGVEVGDIILTKTKQSAFHGTPLLDLLIDRGVDTLVITGGSTSNCVRSAATDSSAYNFRTTVVEDGVFDRYEIDHLVNLFDIDRQLGDVVTAQEVLQYLTRMSTQHQAESEC